MLYLDTNIIYSDIILTALRAWKSKIRSRHRKLQKRIIETEYTEI